MKKIILCFIVLLSLGLMVSCDETAGGNTNNNDFPSGVEQEDKNNIYEGNTPYAKIARELQKHGEYCYNDSLIGIGYQLTITDNNDGKTYLWLCNKVIRFVWENSYGRNTRILFFKLTPEVYESENFITTFKEMYHSNWRKDFFSYTTMKRSDYTKGLVFDFEYIYAEDTSESSFKGLNESCVKHLDRLMEESLKYLEDKKITDRIELGFINYK